jgi:hypothetical protein
MRPLSVRGRLTAIYGGMFLLSGIVLLVIVYLLVSQTLPSATSFADSVMRSRPDGTAPMQTTVPSQPAETDGAAVVDSLAAYRSSTLTTLLIQSAAALLIIAAPHSWMSGSRSASLRPAPPAQLHPQPRSGRRRRPRRPHPSLQQRRNRRSQTKMIKRQGYGRAEFTLLRHRILLG